MEKLTLKLIFMKGLPASGKSTWANDFVEKNPNTVRVNKDEIRIELGMSSWNPGKEKAVIKVQEDRMVQAMKDKKILIVDNTHFNPMWEMKYRKLAAEYKYEFELNSFCDVDVETCVERDQKRANYVGEKVIREMYNKWLKPKPDKYLPMSDAETCAICDLDGTLAIVGDRSYYDASNCDKVDQINTTVQMVLNCLKATGAIQHFVFVSGREKKDEEATKRFLARAGFCVGDGCTHLYMRPTGDKRRDDIVKKEIWEAEIKPLFNVRLVLDDRNQVIRMWRQLGLNVFQVNDGDF